VKQCPGNSPCVDSVEVMCTWYVHTNMVRRNGKKSGVHQPKPRDGFRPKLAAAGRRGLGPMTKPNPPVGNLTRASAAAPRPAATRGDRFPSAARASEAISTLDSLHENTPPPISIHVQAGSSSSWPDEHHAASSCRSLNEAIRIVAPFAVPIYPPPPQLPVAKSHHITKPRFESS
jgi:hypothetical protein